MTETRTKGTKSVIITGGNAGLGFECAKSIAASDRSWHLILASRSEERVRQAAKELTESTGNPNVTPMTVDLASSASIHRFAETMKQADVPPLHAIVCNAGVQIVRRTEATKDGVEATFGVNHLGHYLLVRLLLREMREPGRIVVVSSDVHDPSQKTGMPAPFYLPPETMADPGRSDLAMASLSPSARGQTRYSTSKLCNLYFAYGLDERLRQAGRAIEVHAFNPGMMPGSGLARDYSPLARFAWNSILPLLRFVRPGVRTTRQSGADLARLVASEPPGRTSGTYWDGSKPIPSSPESYSRERAAELWSWSAGKLGLAEHV